MKRLLIPMLGLSLVACGGGGDGTATTTTGGGASSELQGFANTVSSSPGSFSIKGTATGCKTMGANGSCTVTISAYTGLGIYAGDVTLSPAGNYSSTISSCTSASVTTNQCTFTITNSGTTTSQALFILFNGRDTLAGFNIGQ